LTSPCMLEGYLPTAITLRRLILRPFVLVIPQRQETIFFSPHAVAFSVSSFESERPPSSGTFGFFGVRPGTVLNSTLRVPRVWFFPSPPASSCYRSHLGPPWPFVALLQWFDVSYSSSLGWSRKLPQVSPFMCFSVPPSLGNTICPVSGLSFGSIFSVFPGPLGW